MKKFKYSPPGLSKIILGSLALCISVASYATTSEDTVTSVPPKMWGAEELLHALLVLLIALLAIKIIAEIVLIRVAINKLRRTLFEEKGLPIPETLNTNWTETFRRYISGLKPIELEGELVIEDHEYDGIRELNNGMPPWLKYLFTGTIVFAVVYMGYYMVYTNSPTQLDEYAAEMELAQIQKEERRKLQSNAMDEHTVVATTNAAELAQGKKIYDVNCAACHGFAGEGGIGPNFADEYWLHGGGIKNIFKIVKYGVPGKGMVAWESLLSPGDIQKVSSYILTLEGTNPPNAKAPQGEVWKDTEGDTTPSTPSDSTLAPSDTVVQNPLGYGTN